MEHLVERTTIIKCCCLIVDDNVFNRVAIKSILKQIGNYPIYEAENGKVAIEQMNKLLNLYTIIVIFMDYEMPIMNGLEATKEIRRMVD